MILNESRAFVVVWTCGACEYERMTEIVFVWSVEVRRSIGRLGASWIDQVKGVIPY